MKPLYTSCIMAIFMAITVPFLSCEKAREHPLRVMTFNIRNDNPRDGENVWPNRKDFVVSMIRFHTADVVGLQEALRRQIDYLAMQLPEFGWFGVGRDDGISAGEFTAVFYKKDRLDTLRTSTFWLSETPEQPGLGWDAACNRTVTWIRFRDRAARRHFYLFNTHFDHRGEVARVQSAELLLNRISALPAELPVIVTGDFNARPGSEPYKILTTTSGSALKDTRDVSETDHHGPNGTSSRFDLSFIAEAPIDYIFVRANVRVLNHGTLSDTFNGFYPSDHMPVLAEVVF